MKWKYTEQQLRDACKDSLSIRQTMTKVGIREAGGNYSTIKKRIKDFNIDISHFTGQVWNVGSRYKQIKLVQPLKKILVKNSTYQSHKLKLRLLKENYLTHMCYKCNNTTWLNQPIALELEHIDGNHSNNELTNLTLLCPNCHAQTSTYRGKNIRKDTET